MAVLQLQGSASFTSTIEAYYKAEDHSRIWGEDPSFWARLCQNFVFYKLCLL
jgi:hypothetical protein